MNEQAPNRLITLDAIRGVAVMGILAMNIVGFAMPSAAYMNPAALGPPDLLDRLVWAFNFVLVDGKMRGLFSVLFGASTLLVIQSAMARGGSGAANHYARMFWLMLFGLAHYYLIWFGDILFLYAVMGLILFPLRNLKPKTLIIAAIVLMLINFVLFAGFGASLFFLQAAAAAPGASAEAVKTWSDMQNVIGSPGSSLIARELAVYSGSLADIIAWKTDPERALQPFTGLFLFGTETLGLMLLGMALFKTGFLTGEWEERRYRRLLVWCYAIALPVMIALAVFLWSRDFPPLYVFTATIAGASPVRPLLILGHAALALILIKRFQHGAIVKRIAAAGRAAFTNYLGTSIVMTTIFYGYGLALYGEVSRAALYLFVFGMWAVMLLWSKPWLDRFQYGPLEWLWRSLSRFRPQPMRPLPAN